MIKFKETVLPLLVTSIIINVVLIWEFLVSSPRFLSSHELDLIPSNPQHSKFLSADLNLMQPRLPLTLEYGKSVIFNQDSKFLVLNLSLEKNSIAKYSFEIYDNQKLIESGTGQLFENYKKSQSDGKVLVEDVGSKLYINLKCFPTLEWSFQDSKRYYLYSDVELKYGYDSEGANL